MNARFEDVAKVIKEAGIDIDVLGNKNGKENVSDRIKEAVKFAPYIKGDKTPKLPQSAIFNYVTKEKELKLANVQLQHWHLGRTEAEGKALARKVAEEETAKTEKEAAELRARKETEGVSITREQKQFFDLLLKCCKEKAPDILHTVFSEMTEIKLLEAQDRIANELKASMGDIAELIKDEPAATEVPVKKSKRQLQEESEQEISDFLTRMKEIITANETVEKEDLDRLIDLKGKGNQLAADLVEAFETSPETTTQA